MTGRTKKEVKQKAKYAPIEFVKNGSTVKKKVEVKTYQELAELWLDNYRLTVKPQSFLLTKRIVHNHLISEFGSMKLDKITLPQIQRHLNKLSATFVHFGNVHSLNRRILQYGVSLQLLPFNPAREVIMPKARKREDKAIKFIAPEHIKKFMCHMEKRSVDGYVYYFDFVLYSLLLATGCRFGEAVALEWSDIDLENGTVSINKNYSKFVDLVGTPKSKAGIRVISIDKKTCNMLRLYKNRQRLLYLEIGESAPLVVFATPTREYQDMTIRQGALTRRLKECGCPRFTFHAFRHTHASLLLNAGISYKELQYRLGHATLAMTMDKYSHLSKDKEKEAVLYYEKAINNL